MASRGEGGGHKRWRWPLWLLGSTALLAVPAAVWGAREGAARDDVLATWHQLVALHRQWHSLLRELKDAELALGEDPSEANLAWLRDVKARMAEVDGTEALIEGFGELSGRFQKSV